MGRMHVLFAASVFLGCIGAVPDDFAVISSPGSTNTYGYIIQIWSDGDGSVTLQTHDGLLATMPKAFLLPATVAARFFSDLAAARSGNAATVPCMKTVSFRSSLYVSWRDWKSPDLTCPPKESLADALARDAEAIAETAGVSNSTNNPLLRSGPVTSIPPP